MDLIPYQPFRGLERMRSAFDRLWAETLASLGSLTEAVHLRCPVEVVERENEVVVRAELAGMDPQDVEVRITDEALTIRGERRQDVEEAREGFRQSERFYGAFARTVSFPAPVDASQATATFRNGLLEVRAPKRRPDDGRMGRRLDIQVLH